METYPKQWRLVRGIAIVLMAVTALFTLASGLGTSCVAINPTGFGPSMAPLARYQWLYVLFVVITTLLGVLGVVAVVQLIRGRRGAYRLALVALGGGTVIGVIHMLVSRGLRGKSMPVDAVVYVTVFTLAVFLILGGRKWRGVFEPQGTPPTGSGGSLLAALTLIVGGALTLGLPHLMAATHTWNGVNWAAVFPTLTLDVGISQIGIGLGILGWRVLHQPGYKRLPSGGRISVTSHS